MNMPEHLVCPIRLHVFYQPVVASDGGTYEYASICRQFANIQGFAGGRGSTGEPFQNKFLTKNLAMAAQCAEFRDAHRMAEIKYFDIDPEYSAAPAPVANQAPAAVPAAVPDIPVLLSRNLPPGTTLVDLMKHRGFLNEIRIRGLREIVRRMNPLYNDFPRVDQRSKLQWINMVDGTAAWYAVNATNFGDEELVQLLGEVDILSQITHNGFDLMHRI